MTDALPLVAYTELDHQVEAVERDGYVYFPAVLDADAVAALCDVLDSLEPIPASFDRHHTIESGELFFEKVINNAFNRDPLLLSFLDRSPAIEVAERVHGGDCHCIGMTAWLTGPGRPDQALHTDWLPLRLPEHVLADPQVKLPIFITTAHYYLDDLDEALGPTKFVPKSHLSGRSPEGDTTWQGQGEQSLLCQAGDVVLFRSDIWHRGSANRSDRTRYLLQVHYAQRMITQKFPPYLNQFQFDPAILAQASQRQRRLLGDHRPSNYD